ncbi:MAG: type I pullulanase [Oscillospiraceae bacterium]|nr:type I pullulanase [Oscillospiraceae bacterium]
MKRSISLFLCLVLLAGLLSGCGSAPAKSASSASDVKAGPAATSEPAETPETAPVQPPVDEWTLEREAGCNQLTIYWRDENANYDTCDVWIWFPGKDGGGQLFHPCAYGAKCMVNVPEDVAEVGFIVRKNCSDPGGTSWGEATKDYEDDRYAPMNGDTVIYLQAGDGMQYFSNDGGVTLDAHHEFNLAGIVSPTEIKYFISPAARLTASDVKVSCNGRELPVASLSSDGNKVITGVITLSEPLDVSRLYTVELAGYGSLEAVPTDIFDTQAFIDEYVYDGDDLGAVIQGDSTVFKVWAPTASAVALRLFSSGDGDCLIEEIAMERGEKGVWTAEAACGHGTYYTYLVTTALGAQEAVDPYARAVGVNGDRGMVIDLASTDPAGWESDRYDDEIEKYNDAVIWEVHVRDFSNRLEQSQYPGKYLAFTETGLKNSAGQAAGVDYLVDLGVTHVHLQPVYDYATVDETRLDQAQFNWGYDPKNYNAPEGSYSTDPYHGEVRVNEFKQMVQGLHDNGLGVVMDVVYNHTYALDSCLNRIVPYYYYRYNALGAASNGSGCGNETASERAMFRKYMVDSVVYWLTEYHLDGFRFDLMALHDIETMQAIETAVHAINPKALIYGEGWTGGTTTLNGSKQASQANIKEIVASEGAAGGVAVFNDAIRDGLKGSVFDAKSTAYVNGSPSKGNANQVLFGLRGGAKTAGTGWRVEDNQVINYMSCHDNHTLWDKLTISCEGESTESLLAMNRLGAAAVLLSRGTPFFLAGEEFLRSKDGDHNSYNSSDAVNNIDWEFKDDQTAMIDWYKKLIALRKEYGFLKTAEVEGELLEGNELAVTWTQDGETVAVAVFNPNGDMDCELPEGSWKALLGGTGTVSGTVRVGAKDVLFAVK